MRQFLEWFERELRENPGPDLEFEVKETDVGPLLFDGDPASYLGPAANDAGWEFTDVNIGRRPLFGRGKGRTMTLVLRKLASVEYPRPTTPTQFRVVWQFYGEGQSARQVATRIRQAFADGVGVEQFNVLDSAGTWWFARGGPASKENMLSGRVPHSREYKLIWHGLFAGSDAQEAAWTALQGLRDGTASFRFQVTDHTGTVTELDLDE
jgi:hypothetical protein